jgi:predicted ATPase
MIQELYVHNFRCLENFTLSLKGKSSSLLIGKNGSGKTTIAAVLEVFQKIGRGFNQTGGFGGLIKQSDFTRGNTTVPMRFKLKVCIDKKNYTYSLAFEYSELSSSVRISAETILVEDKVIYSREHNSITLLHTGNVTTFFIDWHLVALPLIQTNQGEPLQILRDWLANMIVLSPVPSQINGSSFASAFGSPVYPDRFGYNFVEWLAILLSRYPAAYSDIVKHIKEIMPDFSNFQTPLSTGWQSGFRNLIVQFDGGVELHFDQLSDGEKCFFLSAVVIATNKQSSSSFCFWDEPDNYLAISEVGHFITELRRTFKTNGQILITSHNAQAIEKFSDENTFILDRKSHLEPTLCTLLEDMSDKPKDLISALILGDIAL